MLEAHLPLLIVAVLAVVMALSMTFLGNFLGPKRKNAIKGSVFECGNPVTESVKTDQFNVKFYLVAILFLVFDIEAVFIYPWAVVFSDSVKGSNSLTPWFVFIEMFLFMVIIVVGLTYAWRKGALEWGHTGSPMQPKN